MLTFSTELERGQLRYKHLSWACIGIYAFMGKYLLCLSALSLSQKSMISSKGNVFACTLVLDKGLKLVCQNAVTA